MKCSVALMAALMSVPVFAADASPPMPVEATTVAGDRVLLYPDGHWEPAGAKDTGKAAKPSVVQAVSQSAPTDPGQGGLFGIGRTIRPGDKDYNRGSLNPKLH